MMVLDQVGLYTSPKAGRVVFRQAQSRGSDIIRSFALAVIALAISSARAGPNIASLVCGKTFPPPSPLISKKKCCRPRGAVVGGGGAIQAKERPDLQFSVWVCSRGLKWNPIIGRKWMSKKVPNYNIKVQTDIFL